MIHARKFVTANAFAMFLIVAAIIWFQRVLKAPVCLECDRQAQH